MVLHCAPPNTSTACLTSAQTKRLTELILLNVNKTER